MQNDKPEKPLELTHVSTASRVANLVTATPPIPAVVRWQLQEFPTRIAKKLVAKGRAVLWVVATKKRGDITMCELQASGIAVARIEAAAEDGSDNQSSPQVAKVRKHFKKKVAQASGFPEMSAGTVTIISLGRLRHPKMLREAASNPSLTVVLDHLGVPSSRWLKENPDEKNRKKLPYVRCHEDESNPLLVFQQAQVPTVLIARDELEVKLHCSHLQMLGVKPQELVTKFDRPKSLVTKVIGTNLVYSSYATGAFLSVLACDSDVQVVGEALIGAVTPDMMSMSTQRSLSRAALKISHLSDGVVDLDRMLTSLTRSEVTAMRVRDFIRTAMLGYNPLVRKPELLVLCPTNESSIASSFIGTTAAHLSNWGKLSRAKVSLKGTTSFVTSTVEALTDYPNALAHLGRAQRIADLVQTLPSSSLPDRLCRLAISLRNGCWKQNGWDMWYAPEIIVGEHEDVDKAIGIFYRALDASLPWSLMEPKKNIQHLQLRKEIFRQYKDKTSGK